MQNKVQQTAFARVLLDLFHSALFVRTISINALLELPRAFLHDERRSRALIYILVSLLMNHRHDEPLVREILASEDTVIDIPDAVGVEFTPEIGECVIKIIDCVFAYAGVPIDFGLQNLSRIIGAQGNLQEAKKQVFRTMYFIRQNWRRVPAPVNSKENAVLIKIARLRRYYRDAGFADFIYDLCKRNSSSDPIDLSKFI